MSRRSINQELLTSDWRHRAISRSALDLRFITLALTFSGCAAVILLAAPWSTTRVAVHVTGDGARAAAGNLFAAASAQIDARTDVRMAGDTVTISRAEPTGPLVESEAGVGALMAMEAIRSVREAPAPLPVTAAPPPMPAGRSDNERVGTERAGVLTLLTAADQRVTALSSGITDVARALADTQRQDATAQTGDLPARALLAQLQARRIDLAARYNADYPGIAIADDEIAQLRGLVDQEALGRPRPAAAIATLRAEQQRLTLALSQESTRRDALDARLSALDAPHATPAVAPPAATPPIVPLEYLIEPLGSSTAPDLRYALCGALLLAGAAIWWRQSRTRTLTFTQHLTLLEQKAHLPVLRCLDVHADSCHPPALMMAGLGSWQGRPGALPPSSEAWDPAPPSQKPIGIRYTRTGMPGCGSGGGSG